jgi:hypothetical protein
MGAALAADFDFNLLRAMKLGYSILWGSDYSGQAECFGPARNAIWGFSFVFNEFCCYVVKDPPN